MVAVDIRGRRWFTWRCLRHGRRSASPLHGFIERTARGASIGTRFVPFVLSGVAAVDIRGRWWFIWRCFHADAGCVAPTRIYRTHRAGARPIGTRCVPPWASWSRSTRGRWWFIGGVYERATPASPLGFWHRTWARPLARFVPAVRGGRGRHSWSTVVHLEVFTTKGDAVRRPYTDRPPIRRSAYWGVSMGMGLNDDCPLLPSLIPDGCARRQSGQPNGGAQETFGVTDGHCI